MTVGEKPRTRHDRRPRFDAARRLSAVLRAALGPAARDFRLIDGERLKRKVHRLRFLSRDGSSSVVIKRMAAPRARRNQQAIQRWLPAAGLEALAPRLLGVAADRTGAVVWHVYEDLGSSALDGHDPEPERLFAAARTVATLHARFTRHPILAECRLDGGDLGIPFLEASAEDALRALHALRPPHLLVTPIQAALRDRLLHRVERLIAEWPERAKLVSACGGPPTLLHGDLWPANVIVEPNDGGWRVRFIDWDHVGVGPASYDLSTFLLRSPAERRRKALSVYCEALADQGWGAASPDILNRVFETTELGRCANRLVWPALALLRDHTPWGFDVLAEVERWFESLEPTLPTAGLRTPGGEKGQQR